MQNVESYLYLPTWYMVHGVRNTRSPENGIGWASTPPAGMANPDPNPHPIHNDSCIPPDCMVNTDRASRPHRVPLAAVNPLLEYLPPAIITASQTTLSRLHIAT